jgi:hypothetical protein
VQGDDVLGTFTVVALLASCVRVSYRRDRAVIRDNGKLGEIYRACGADIAIADDVPVKRFACFAGDVPSYHLAAAMQEECVALVLRNRRLSLVRLPDFFRQTPVDTLGQADTTDIVESEFLERHEIPAFLSVNDDGDFVFGDFSRPRNIQYQPCSDERILRNMSRVLVTRRLVESQLAEQINAGDILDVENEKLVVITAVHYAEANEGITESNSRFWVGSISQ